jgi:hypothetical protein
VIFREEAFTAEAQSTQSSEIFESRTFYSAASASQP